jgi:hypothetical protein
VPAAVGAAGSGRRRGDLPPPGVQGGFQLIGESVLAVEVAADRCGLPAPCPDLQVPDDPDLRLGAAS